MIYTLLAVVDDDRGTETKKEFFKPFSYLLLLLPSQNIHHEYDCDVMYCICISPNKVDVVCGVGFILSIIK